MAVTLELTLNCRLRPVRRRSKHPGFRESERIADRHMARFVENEVTLRRLWIRSVEADTFSVGFSASACERTRTLIPSVLDELPCHDISWQKLRFGH